MLFISMVGRAEFPPVGAGALNMCFWAFPLFASMFFYLCPFLRIFLFFRGVCVYSKQSCLLILSSELGTQGYLRTESSVEQVTLGALVVGVSSLMCLSSEVGTFHMDRHDHAWSPGNGSSDALTRYHLISTPSIG